MRIEEPDLYCQCGDPRCAKYNHAFFRVGAVFHGDEVAPYDMLHVEVFDHFPEENRTDYASLMFTEEQAKKLTWYLACYYLTPFQQVARCLSILNSWWWCYGPPEWAYQWENWRKP